MEDVRRIYGVDARIFFSIYAVKAILFWLVFAWIIRALRARDWKRFSSWCLLEIGIFLAPYTYAYVAGRNLPLWCSWLYAALVALAVLLLSWKIRLALARCSER